MGLDSAEPPHHIAWILKCSRCNILIVESLVRNVQLCHDCAFYCNQVSFRASQKSHSCRGCASACFSSAISAPFALPSARQKAQKLQKKPPGRRRRPCSQEKP